MGSIVDAFATQANEAPSVSESVTEQSLRHMALKDGWYNGQPRQMLELLKELYISNGGNVFPSLGIGLALSVNSMVKDVNLLALSGYLQTGAIDLPFLWPGTSNNGETGEDNTIKGKNGDNLSMSYHHPELPPTIPKGDDNVKHVYEARVNLGEQPVVIVTDKGVTIIEPTLETGVYRMKNVELSATDSEGDHKLFPGNLADDREVLVKSISGVSPDGTTLHDGVVTSDLRLVFTPQGGGDGNVQKLAEISIDGPFHLVGVLVPDKAVLSSPVADAFTGKKGALGAIEHQPDVGINALTSQLNYVNK